MKMNCLIAAFALALSAGASVAQNAVVSRPALTASGAKALAGACFAWARKARPDRDIAVAVVDAGGALMYYERTDGATAQTGAYALGKAETARQTGSLSGADMDRLTKNPPDLQVLTFNRLGLQGGVAIRAGDKTLLGAIGVSGMASAEDELCGETAIEKVVGSAS
ncbi:GlcG/HbpS family heme-binding protein [Sinorhizobium meliloti]|nr:heme-binding protein [Sinorhizobium meliloti]